MFERSVEDGLLYVLEEEGIVCIDFSPLAQGSVTDKYIKEIPKESRASKEHGFFRPAHIIPERLKMVIKLNEIASKRNQTHAQMALVWILRHPAMTSLLIGASMV